MLLFLLLTLGNIRSPCDTPLWTDDSRGRAPPGHSVSAQVRSCRVVYPTKPKPDTHRETPLEPVAVCTRPTDAHQKNPWPTFGRTPTALVLPFSVCVTCIRGAGDRQLPQGRTGPDLGRVSRLPTEFSTTC